MSAHDGSVALPRPGRHLLASLIFGGGLIYAAGRSGLRRYWILFGLSLVLGIALTAVEVPGRYASVQIYLLGMGAITIEKAFVEKIPRTVYQITPDGAKALDASRRVLNGCLDPIVP